MSDKPAKYSNIPEFSVSELAFSLKRTLEDNYARVRVRGELSRISIPKSGHMYSSLKDDKSVIDAICWKGVLSKLSVRPEEGLEVICIGRITTYPARSNYQLIIESMELAGEGALLKMLEDRKKKLAAEGLFAPEKKRKLPFLPEKIGVVTSPTGAVIRDILHRLNDRFPRHVIVWPVKVQGQGADKEIEAAINGFNALDSNNRPDIIIVARGGGSLEDLMPFNEENVVRAAANSSIAIISAVGHETDTTLIDYACDMRAPTPTGAAEMTVPVRLNLITQITDNEKRLANGASRFLSEKRYKLESLSAKLGDPVHILEIKIQNLDRISDRLDHGFKNYISVKKHNFIKKTAHLRTPRQNIQTAKTSLNLCVEQLERYKMRTIDNKVAALKQIQEKLELLSFENVLKRGYVVVWGEEGKPITQAEKLHKGQNINLQFKDQKKIGAIINTNQQVKTNKKRIKKLQNNQNQGSLF